MFRKILTLFAIGGTTASTQPAVRPDPTKLMPYVVPTSYLDFQKTDEKHLSWPLGHGLHVVLVHDLNGAFGNVTAKDLRTLGLAPPEARRLAVANLESLAKSGAIGQRRFIGPDQKPFVLFGGHWAAAACILLPRLHELGVTNLQTQEICVCIPHREALLMFPRSTGEYRETMLKMIKERESDSRKPLTFALFELTSAGVSELK